MPNAAVRVAVICRSWSRFVVQEGDICKLHGTVRRWLAGMGE